MGRSVVCAVKQCTGAVYRSPAARFCFVFLFVLVLVMPVSAPAAPEAFRVNRSDQQGIVLKASGLTPVWKPVTPAGRQVTLYDVEFPGFTNSGAPGDVRLPHAGGWILVPPGTTPRLKILSETWTDAAGRPLTVEPLPLVIPGVGDEPGRVSEILVLPGEEIPAEAPVPQSVRDVVAHKSTTRPAGADLGEVVWWRGRRIVPFHLVPVRSDARGLAGATLEAGAWEVEFVRDKSASGEIPAGHDRKRDVSGDSRFGSVFLNPELLSGTGSEAALAPPPADASGAEKDRGGKAGALLGDEVKIPINKTRLTKISYRYLAERQVLPAGGVDEAQIRLYQRRYRYDLDDGSTEPPYFEIEVPIHMVGEGNEFTGDDYFIFYALEMKDDVPYWADLGDGSTLIPGCGDPFGLSNEFNWYWLAFSEPDAGRPWTRMQKATLLPTPATVDPMDSYPRVDRHEEQISFRENPPTLESDRLYANHYKDASVEIGLSPLWSPDTSSLHQARIEVTIAGYNNATRYLQIILQKDDTADRTLLSPNIESSEDTAFPIDLHPRNLIGDNLKVLVNERNGSDRMYATVNYIDVSYDALFQAITNRLEFNAGAGYGFQPIEVTGFTSSDIGLVETTDPRNPVLIELEAANIVADGGTWTLSIQPTQTGETRRFVSAGNWSTTGVNDWVYYRSILASDPVNPTLVSGPDPELIVITHPDFRQPLERWIQHRKDRAGGDLAVHVVETDDLYDWYNGGMKGPWALKRFVTHAITEWGSAALVLVGDANENGRGREVREDALGWSTDWVPTHFHVQETWIDEPELLATDKWYGCLAYGEPYGTDTFPYNVRQPWDMMVGRLPCNSAGELNAMIDKIILVETPDAGQQWRRHGLFFADDAWSNDYGDFALNYLSHRDSEEDFADSARDSYTVHWRTGTPVALAADTLFLDTVLDPYWGDWTDPQKPIKDVREDTYDYARPPLQSFLSQGGLLAHYQGHGNAYVMATEYWFMDRGGSAPRLDLDSVSNTGKPWVYFGMGCHLADWAANTVNSSTLDHEQSLCEKFLVRPNVGASASYGSSGFEYITENRVFGEYIFRRWLKRVPNSRWVLGEVLWSSEADMILARGVDDLYREMVAQYTLLGDPLMVLDAGPPEVTAALVGDESETLFEEWDLTATDQTNRRMIDITARDEAGIDRLRVTERGTANDLTDEIVTETIAPGYAGRQAVDYRLDLPVEPRAYVLDVELWDTGASLPGDRHYTLALNVGMEAEFLVDGEVIDTDEFTFVPGEPVHFTGSVTSAAWLTPDLEIGLESENLVISNWSSDLINERVLDFSFTAEALGETGVEHSVELSIGGYVTEYVLEAGAEETTENWITDVFSYPNPMRSTTRIVFGGADNAERGWIRVFATSGRQVARIEVKRTPAPVEYNGMLRWSIPWNGRDELGDKLANGTYLYRVEMETAAGPLVSEMQRLVLMR